MVDLKIIARAFHEICNFSLLFQFIILSIDIILNVNSADFVNTGFTPHRLTERHVHEERLTVLAQYRLSVANQERFVIHKYLNNDNQAYYSLMRNRHFRSNLQKLLHRYFIANVHRIISDTRHNIYRSPAEDEAGSHELLLHFQGWFHLQEMLLLKPKNLSIGLDLDTRKPGRLTAAQSAELGIFHLWKLCYYMAVEWLEVSTSKAQSSYPSRRIRHSSSDLLATLYHVSVQQHNKKRAELYKNAVILTSNEDSTVFDTINFYTQPIKLGSPVQFPFFRKSDTKVVPEERRTNREEFYEKSVSEIRAGGSASLYARFMDACMGNRRMSVEEQATLHCYMDTKRDPLFYINPLYVEVISQKKQIFQAHKVLSDQMIDYLFARRREDLQSGDLNFGMTDTNNGYPSCRPTENTPMRLIRLTEAITGLKFVYCTQNIVFVEGTLGRTTWEHNDHSGDRSPEAKEIGKVNDLGDFLASVLYYLEEPKSGGRTPFMPAMTFIPPVKGSAGFWFNMRRNGEYRYQDTEHGGCPPVHGGKVAMANFLRYNANWQQYRCSLNPNE